MEAPETSKMCEAVRCTEAQYECRLSDVDLNKIIHESPPGLIRIYGIF